MNRNARYERYDDVPSIERKRETAPDIHGDSGMDGPELPAPTRTIDQFDTPERK